MKIIPKTILWKQNKVGGPALPDSRTYMKVAVTEIELCWHEDRHRDQWNRTETPVIGPHIFVNWFSSKVTTQLNGDQTTLPKMVLGQLTIQMENKWVSALSSCSTQITNQERS